MHYSRCLFLIYIVLSIDFSMNCDTCVPTSSLNSCQLFHTWQDKSGNPLQITSQNKYNTPLGTMACARKFNLSHLRLATTKNHPSGQTLFPTNSTFAALLNNFLSSIDKNNYFLVYFSRIHLVILHELYSYLMKIYTTFNMNVTRDLKEYLTNEPTQALNRKTHIINHFLNIIEAQSNQAITSRMPALPKHLATYTGNTLLLNHDYGADLNLLIENQELNVVSDPVVQQGIRDMRSDYLTIFGNYLQFFRAYTISLEQPDPTYGSVFVRHATEIQKIMSNATPTIDPNSPLNQRATILRQIQLINPPIFFYDDETLRSLKVIPKTASTFGPKIQKVGWPTKVVQDAQNPKPIVDKNGIVISKLPPAYFVDAQGNQVTNIASAARLYVNIPTLDHMYTQQILQQPTWLNSYQGVMLMLRACLGDFTALFDPIFTDELILDPCMRCIIMNSAIKAGIVVSAQPAQVCQECQDYLSSLRKLISQQQQSQQGPPPPPPDLSQGPP
ncbi:MAG: hypothetical protein BWY54_00667 [Candidatus Dependentiae bacterium ADurb.Bin331]|nr:MAG: hypothetical protein BWY54_00667 [Candidatus Dependentiae bacterium ADurb.Bin331]